MAITEKHKIYLQINKEKSILRRSESLDLLAKPKKTKKNLRTL